jgi:hypothetical protein
MTSWSWSPIDSDSTQFRDSKITAVVLAVWSCFETSVAPTRDQPGYSRLPPSPVSKLPRTCCDQIVCRHSLASIGARSDKSAFCHFPSLWQSRYSSCSRPTAHGPRMHEPASRTATTKLSAGCRNWICCPLSTRKKRTVSKSCGKTPNASSAGDGAEGLTASAGRCWLCCPPRSTQHPRPSIGSRTNMN